MPMQKIQRWLGLESENFTGGKAKIGEQRPELESER